MPSAAGKVASDSSKVYQKVTQSGAVQDSDKVCHKVEQESGCKSYGKILVMFTRKLPKDSGKVPARFRHYLPKSCRKILVKFTRTLEKYPTYPQATVSIFVGDISGHKNANKSPTNPVNTRVPTLSTQIKNTLYLLKKYN